MRLLASSFVAVCLMASALAQQSAPSTRSPTQGGTHFLPPPHASVTIENISIGDMLDEPHWWNDGATFTNIYSHGDIPNVALVGRDGSLAFKTTLTAPNLDRIRVTDAARMKTGHVVATTQFADADHHVGSYIAELDAEGRVVRQLNTFPFIPEMVCPADDGTVWTFGWDWYRGNQPRTYPYRANRMFQHYSFTQGLIRAAVNSDDLGNRVLFGYHVVKGTRVGCTENKAWAYYGERGQFIAYDEKSDSFHTYRVIMPSGAPDDVGVSGFARTAAGDFYGSLNDGSQAWLGLFRLYIHSDVAEWAPIDSPGDFKTGIRVFGASGNDLVYSRSAWTWPHHLLFSSMPEEPQASTAARILR